MLLSPVVRLGRRSRPQRYRQPPRGYLGNRSHEANSAARARARRRAVPANSVSSLGDLVGVGIGVVEEEHLDRHFVSAHPRVSFPFSVRLWLVSAEGATRPQTPARFDWRFALFQSASFQ